MIGAIDDLIFHWNLTKMCLKALAVWPLTDLTSFARKLLDYIHLITIAAMALQQGVNMMITAYITSEDLITASESLGPMMALYVAFGKICIYRYNRGPLTKLANRVEETLKNTDYPEYEFLKEYMKYGNLASALVYSSIVILVGGNFSMPLLLHTQELPFVATYPWNWRNSTMGYTAAYLHEVTLTSVLSCASVTEFTYIWFICHCCARLKVVQGQLRDQGKDRTVMNAAIKLHTEVLGDVTSINTAFTNIVLLLFLAAVIAICCAGLTITNETTDMTVTVLFVVLAVYYAQQLLFYYLPGDILSDHTMEVGNSAYASGWENSDVCDQKIVGLIIYRCNFPPNLLAGNLSPLLLENYMSFLATTASYFTSISAVATRD